MSIGLNVPITSSWNGAGTKAAAKELGALDGLANKLAKRLAATFTVGAIAQFAKTSVKNFTEANKQFTIMSKSLDNLGLSVGITKLEDFFNTLEKKFGQDKSILIPAFQTLINSTHDYAKSQQLLNLSLDVAAGTGKDLASVSMAIGKAYAGQTTALTRLGIGLSTASIKGKSFVQIQKELTAQFTGAASSAADTYQGKLDKLNVTFGNMQETIGKGIITGLENAFSGGNINGFQNAMEKTGEYVSNIAIGLGVVASEISKIVNSIPKPVLNLVSSLKSFGAWSLLSQLGKKKSAQTADMLASLADPVAEGLLNVKNRQKATQLAKDAAAQAAKDLAAQKAITAQKAQQLALEKAKAVLTQAAKVLDVQQAEIVAAMMNASLSENELLRLKLKQALLNDNASAAKNFANELINSQIAALELARANPFAQMNTDIMSAINSLLQLQALMNAIGTKQYAPTISTAAGTFYTSSTGATSNTTSATWGQYYQGLSGGLYGSTPTQNVTVTIVDQTSSGVTVSQNASLNGTPATVTRYNPISDR